MRGKETIGIHMNTILLADEFGAFGVADTIDIGRAICQYEALRAVTFKRRQAVTIALIRASQIRSLNGRIKTLSTKLRRLVQRLQ